MKKEIIDDMNTRVADVAAQPLYAVATIVDPRCRGKLFSQSEFVTAKQGLVDAQLTLCNAGSSYRRCNYRVLCIQY